MSVTLACAIAVTLTGLALCALAWFTWGADGGMFSLGLPYRSFAFIGVAMIALGVWGLLS